MLNLKLLSLITANPQKIHIRTGHAFTLESAYLFCTQFKPEVEYLFYKGMFNTVAIHRGDETSVGIPYFDRNTVEIHSHPGHIQTRFIPSISDQYGIYINRNLGGIISIFGLTIYRGIDLKYLYEYDLYNKKVIDRYLDFRDKPFNILKLALDNTQEIELRKKIPFNDRFRLFKWNQLFKFYSPKTDVFNIVKQKSLELFPDYLSK